MKKLLMLTTFLISTPLSAKSLPPILDYLPSCSPIVIDGIYIEKPLSGSTNSTLIEAGFDQVRQTAKKKRVDAVIITNLIQTNKLIITADLIDFCDDDDSLSNVSTAYNQLSRRPLIFERAGTTPTRVASSISTPKPAPQVARAAPKPAAVSKPKPASRSSIQAPKPAPAQVAYENYGATTFKSPLMSELELARLAAKAKIPNTNVTLSGAYGININNSKSYLEKILGPASAVFTLSPTTQAWLYGRDLWFYIESDKVKKITYKERSLLNYTGKNAILYNEDYDNTWAIDDKAVYRDDVNAVRTKLNYLKQKSKAEYTVSNKKNLLKLDFSEYSSYNGNQPDLLLSGFTFHSRDYYREESQILYSKLNTELLDDLLVPSTGAPSLKLDDVVERYVPNVINFSSDGSWEVLTKNILVKHDDHKITKVRLSESINDPVESDEEFKALLKQMNVPATKEELLSYYGSDAESWAETVEVTNDDYELRAEFESEDDDAMLISLEVEYLRL